MTSIQLALKEFQFFTITCATCAFIFKILHNTAQISINNIILKHSYAKIATWIVELN